MALDSQRKEEPFLPARKKMRKSTLPLLSKIVVVGIDMEHLSNSLQNLRCTTSNVEGSLKGLANWGGYAETELPLKLAELEGSNPTCSTFYLQASN
jgi:predicted transcriptional regulator with HTH domain